ncbi:MAG: polysaccharide deacetylase family protein [Deltaproteobacteria bacterium]|nr:polysaccharide deacetylase family protein [Deltaproteobacteria bacterium]
MICLTGDLHHRSLRTDNQRHSDLSELECARRYLALLEDAGVKVTFFASGRCFVEDWDELAPIAAHPLVELGGHNWSCLTPAIVHRVWRKAIGSYNGPPWWQELDARLTIEAARRRTGRTIRVWRNHMYMHGPWTEQVLRRAGIALVSDGVRRDATGPERHPSGILTFPLNVIPDHEHLYHAERTPEWVARWQARYRWSDDFGPDSYRIGDWVEIVLANLRDNEARGAVSNMIVHPITMWLCDRFEGFRRILACLATRRTAHLGELVGAT